MAFIVFGLSPTGLFLIQQLSKTSEPIYSIDRKGKIGFYSKFSTKIEINNVNDLKESVTNIISKNENVKGFITSSDLLNLIIEEMPELFNMIDIIGPTLSLSKTLNRKSDAYNLFSNHLIKFPESYFYNDYNQIQNFPIILKWNTEIPTLKFSDLPIGKTLIVKTKEEMLEVVKNIETYPSVIRDNILFQEFISNKNLHQIGFCGFFWHGKAKMNILVKQIRQHPQGMTSFAKELPSELYYDLIQHVSKILKDNDYNGFIEIEFLHDDATNNFYILDVNPRAWGYIKILTKKYPSFALLFEDFNKTIESVTKSVQFVDLQRDFIAIARRTIMFKFKFLLKDIVSVIKPNTAVNIFELNDPKPFFVGAPIIFLKNIFSKK